MDKELIKKIRQLRQIKPSQDWVVFAKREILGEELPAGRERISINSAISTILEIFPRIIFQKKLAYAVLTIFIILVGTLGFAQSTVPGDLLFSVKKISEKTQAVFVSEKAQYDLEIANKRLEDLIRVDENNREEAFKEYQASVSQAAKNLVKEEPKNDPETVNKIVLELKKLEENKMGLGSLGIIIEESEETKELDNALAPFVQREIEKLQNSTLTDEQEKLLEEAKEELEKAKEELEKGNYSEAFITKALIKVWQISN